MRTSSKVLLASGLVIWLACLEPASVSGQAVSSPIEWLFFSTVDQAHYYGDPDAAEVQRQAEKADALSRKKRTIGTIVDKIRNFFSGIFGGGKGNGGGGGGSGYGAPKPTYNGGGGGGGGGKGNKGFFSSLTGGGKGGGGLLAGLRGGRGKQRGNRGRGRGRRPIKNQPGVGGPGNTNPYGTTFGGPPGGGYTPPAPGYNAPNPGYNPPAPIAARPPQGGYGAPQGPVVNNRPQAPISDGYGAPQGPVLTPRAPVQDGYGAPQGPIVNNRPSAPVQDGYGAPQGPVVQTPVQDGYGAPQGPVIGGGASQNTAVRQPVSNVQDGYGAPQGPVIGNSQPVRNQVANQDSYGSPQGAVIGSNSQPVRNQVANQDSYGSPQGQVIGSSQPVRNQQPGGLIPGNLITLNSPNYNPPSSSASIGVSQSIAPQSISDNVIKMLPAPNLATAAPTSVQGQSAGGFSSSPAADSYGVPSGQVVNTGGVLTLQPDTNSGPSPPAQDSYGIPQGGVITNQNNNNNAVNTIRDNKGIAQVPLSGVTTVMNPFTGHPTTVPVTVASPAAASQAPDSYSVGQQPAPVITNRQPNNVVSGNAPPAPTSNTASAAAAGATDAYGSPLAPVGTSAPVPDEYSVNNQVSIGSEIDLI